MADKILKTLSLDGFEVDAQKIVQDNSGVTTTNISTVNTWIDGATLTLTTPGLHLLRCNANLTAASTTGATYRGIQIALGSNDSLVVLSMVNGDNKAWANTIAGYYNVATAPVTIKARILSSKTCTDNKTSLVATRIITV